MLSKMESVDNNNHSASTLESRIVGAIQAKNIDEIINLLAHRDDQKFYGKLVAEIAAENGHLEVFELLRSYGIIHVGNALHKAG